MSRVRLFVTGTDTDVGKTRVTGLLARAARQQGRTVVACKVVASGVPPGHPGDDATHLGEAAGHAPLVFGTWETPVSPHRAALLEGRPAPTDLLVSIRALHADVVLVEGVGGWRVPISVSPPLWVEDLAHATAGEVVVVAANRLGVLNHTLLTLDAVRRSGLRVRAVVLSSPTRSTDASTPWNHADLELLGDAPVYVVGFLEDDAQVEAAVTDLGRVILPPTECP